MTPQCNFYLLLLSASIPGTRALQSQYLTLFFTCAAPVILPFCICVCASLWYEILMAITT